ncbi:MAG: hypothetical protein AB1641_26245 [Thermodesulfobacteriota bacterium]
MKTLRRRKGYLLLEVMLVAALAAMLTPVAYRLYHEGVKRGFDRLQSVRETRRDARVLFKYLALDLGQARTLLPSFGQVKADARTLIVQVRPLSERNRLLAAAGDLSDDGPPPSRDVTIVYRLGRDGQVFRDEYAPEGAKTTLALLGDVKSLEFGLEGSADRPGGVTATVIRRPKVGPEAILTRVFSVGR